MAINNSKLEDSPTSYDVKFESATGLRDSGDLKNAVIILSELIRDHPKNHAAYLVIGDIYWDMKKLDKAEEAFRQATILKPSSEICSLGLFHVLTRNDKDEEAMAEMERYLNDYTPKEYKLLLDEMSEAYDNADTDTINEIWKIQSNKQLPKSCRDTEICGIELKQLDENTFECIEIYMAKGELGSWGLSTLGLCLGDLNEVIPHLEGEILEYFEDWRDLASTILFKISQNSEKKYK